MKTKLLIVLSLTSVIHAYAGSAAWKLNPTSSDWNTAANWTPATVPNGPADTATFAFSNSTSVSQSANTEVAGIVFSAGASAFTITPGLTFTLTISGTGIVNNSGGAENFVIPVAGTGGRGLIAFRGSATAGSLTTFTNLGATTIGSAPGGETDFFDTSSAGNANFANTAGQVSSALSGTTEFFGSSTAGNGNFINHGATAAFADGGETNFFETSTAGNAVFSNEGGSTIAPELPIGAGGTLTTTSGHIEFHDSSTASSGTFTNNGGAVVGGNAGSTFFFDTATAGNAVFTNTPASATDAVSAQMGFFGASSAGSATLTSNGAAMSSVEAPLTQFFDHSTAADCTLINNGGMVSGAFGATILFEDSSTAGNATLIANGGISGGAGARLLFLDRSTGGVARVELFGNGDMEISSHLAGFSVGSIEGDGLVSLGSASLRLGLNKLSTTFSGVIQGSGSLVKLGTGTLTVGGDNTYTGGTTINDGALLVQSSKGSSTGTGPIQVIIGTFGGTGSVTGPVTVGTGSNSGAFLAPGKNRKHPGTLAISGPLTLNSDGTYQVELSGKHSIADKIVAAGVTINNAHFSFAVLGNSALSDGTVFTVIDNTASTPMSGTFANLADGSIFTIGRNTFEVSYEGGDGNDLTLTVVP
jgi:autotransporter-associated beta strand protein